MDERESKKSNFWATAPGVLGALAAVITAVAGLISLLHTTGILTVFPQHEDNDIDTPTPGTDLVLMPQLIDFKLNDAIPILESKNLRIESIQEVSSSPNKSGRIISQEPSPGASVNKGDAVKLYVGSTKVEVPSVIGFTPDKAKSVLEEAGLRSNPIKKVVAQPSQVGKVVNQEPLPEVRVERGTNINLYIGRTRFTIDDDPVFKAP